MAERRPWGRALRAPLLIGWPSRHRSQWERALLSGAQWAGAGGRGGQAVAVETPGEVPGRRFGCNPGWGRGALLSRGESGSGGLRGSWRGPRPVRMRGTPPAVLVTQSGKQRPESGSYEAGPPGCPAGLFAPPAASLGRRGPAPGSGVVHSDPSRSHR